MSIHFTNIWQPSVSQELCWSLSQFSHLVLSNSSQSHGLQHARVPCPSPTPRALLKLMMPSNHLILCHPLLLLPSNFPSIRVFLNESVPHIRWPNIGVSSSATVLPMNTQDWFPLGWTAWVSLQSKGLPKVFSNTTVQNHQMWRLLTAP